MTNLSNNACTILLNRITNFLLFNTEKAIRIELYSYKFDIDFLFSD